MNIPAIIAEFCGYFTAFILAINGYGIQGILLTVFLSFFFIPCIRSQIEIIKNLIFVRNADLKKIDAMNTADFAKYLSECFSKKGYHVSILGCGDHDAELMLTLQGTPRTLVVLRNSVNHTGTKTIQNAILAKDAYKCKRVLIVTNGIFTQEAEKVASKNEVRLWDRDKIKHNLCGKRRCMIEDDILPSKIKAAG